MDQKMYKEKVMGCWIGKAVGGTLGQPYEGCDGPLNLSYYDPVPTGMIPNDDLDLQVLWACVLEKMETPIVDRDTLAQAWLDHVDFPWDEYGIAIRNIRDNIMPPMSGTYDNWFVDGLGAAIRSEIWACLAPNNPELAAAFAYEDACVDHTGDGIYAEMFLAALESAAFSESDLNKLIEIGLSVIPSDCRLTKAITDTMKWCQESDDYLATRQKILDVHGSENFTDVVMNIPFIILSLVLCKGDFSQSICMSVNCGRDADCTTATVGSILGIMNPDLISENWVKPIGHDLILDHRITGITPPDDLEKFTNLIIELSKTIKLREETPSQEVDLTPFTITAQTGLFGPWFPQDDGKFNPVLPEKTETIQFSGSRGSIPASKIPNDSLFMMKFEFSLEKEQNVRIMFNTPSNSRVWIDGEYAFGREGGRMSPSFHRCPPNQVMNKALTAGKHELIVGVAPIADETEIEWVMGIGDPESQQWLPVKFS